jgi:ribosomal protein L6P/L9E
LVWFFKLIKIYKNKSIFIPTSFKICLTKIKNTIKLIAFNEKKTIKSYIDIKNNSLHLDSENNILHINNTKTTEVVKWSNILNSLFFTFNHYFFKKIKFKGKGFRLKLKKQKKICKFLFGHSHLMVVYIKNMRIHKCTKYKFNLKSVNKNYLQKVSEMMLNIKPNNVYTNRGIREGRQLILRRKGKKGSYT